MVQRLRYSRDSTQGIRVARGDIAQQQDFGVAILRRLVQQHAQPPHLHLPRPPVLIAPRPAMAVHLHDPHPLLLDLAGSRPADRDEFIQRLDVHRGGVLPHQEIGPAPAHLEEPPRDAEVAVPDQRSPGRSPRASRPAGYAPGHGRPRRAPRRRPARGRGRRPPRSGPGARPRSTSRVSRMRCWVPAR